MPTRAGSAPERILTPAAASSQNRLQLTWAARFCAARLDCDNSLLALRPSPDGSSPLGCSGGAGAMAALEGPAVEPGLWPEGGAIGIMLAVLE